MTCQPLAKLLSLPLVLGLSGAVTGNGALPSGLFVPRYTAGEVLHYRMKANNQGWQYALQATDTVKRDPAGAFYQEIGWSGLQSNAPMTLSPASLALRQTVSLEDPRKYMAIPDLSKVQPLLIGPITDTLTFYSDLLLAMQHHLGPANPHVYVEHATANSWADGQHFLIAQDAIDLDISLEGKSASEHTATLLIRHVPPKHPQITLSADWMKQPVADTPNNWVQVSRHGNGYLAEVGRETFDVRMTVDTRDGKLLSAHLDNPVTALSRECEDAALTRCAAPTPENIHREVSLTLLP